MSGTGLAAIGWGLSGIVIGLTIGWLMGIRRVRTVRHRLEQEHRTRREQTRSEATALSCSLRGARNRLGELESVVLEHEALLEERNRKVAKLQAQVIDRESTINSLRSRLYGARISATLLEEELESLQSRISDTNSDSAGGSTHGSSLMVSLDDGLEIEMTPRESRTIGSG